VRESAQWALDLNGARGTARRAFRFSRHGRHDPLLVAPFGDGLVIVDPRDQEIGRVVYMRGEYQRRYFTSAVDHLCATTGLVPRGKVVLDVGANIGTTTIDALRQSGFGRCLSFEPDPANVRLLRANVVLNDLQDRVTVIAAAASDEDGELVLVRNETNSGDSRVRPGDGAGSSESVHAVRIDTVLAEHDVAADRVGLLWVDVQGHETRVLLGATSLTAAGVPVVVEYGLLDDGDLERLEALAAEHYTHVVDVRRLAADPHDERAVLACADLPELRGRHGLGHETDLLLVRRTGSPAWR
jgi:FkbM family methyltransferase